MDVASHQIQNLASTTWMIYSSNGELVVSGGAYLGHATNSVVEYSAVIELLHEAILNGILYLEV